MAEKQVEKKQEKSKELPNLKGKYISVVGRRKTSTARIRLFKKGTGAIVVNSKLIEDYYDADKIVVAVSPLKLTNHSDDVNISVVVRGGGITGQVEAIRHGISRALIELDEELRMQIKTKGWVTRDARKKERKKPGLKKARKAPQWSKR